MKKIVRECLNEGLDRNKAKSALAKLKTDPEFEAFKYFDKEYASWQLAFALRSVLKRLLMGMPVKEAVEEALDANGIHSKEEIEQIKQATEIFGVKVEDIDETMSSDYEE